VTFRELLCWKVDDAIETRIAKTWKAHGAQLPDFAIPGYVAVAVPYTGLCQPARTHSQKNFFL
jgi:hypothetical protein